MRFGVKVASAVLLVVLLVLGVLVLLDYLAPKPPRSQQALHLPSAGVQVDPASGRDLFLSRCSRCHGQDLKGTDRGPPLVHPVYRPAHHSDLAFHLAVRNGVQQHHWHFGNMPPVQAMSPEQVEHIIAFVRQEQRRAGIE